MKRKPDLVLRSLLMVERDAVAADVAARIAERDRRLAADTRTDAERWLGDPDPSRSALSRPRKDPTGQP
jgi:hypothetical protein